MDAQRTRKAVEALAGLLTARGWRLATAESCTGGLVAAALTDLSGSSAWYEGGVVAYANAVKEAFLDVPGALLTAHGAVSREVVLAMAQGAARRFGARCALSISGVAGPTGGTPDKPVGTVWLGWEVDGATDAQRHLFPGDRQAVRAQAALAALEGLGARLR